MAYITTRDNTKLYVKDWGQGRPVILLHGWPLSADSWDDQAMAIADAGFRITRTDEPRPDAKLSEDHPWLARWHAHAPLVLFVEAKKEPTRSRVEGRTGRRLIAPGSAAKDGAANESAHRSESMQGEVDRGTLVTSAMKQFPKTRARLAK